jgi:HAD superfamily hydrolase (TIGR01509 family)
MSVKAVIFDMDGVIVDSEPIESLAWEKILIEYKKKPIYLHSGLIHQVGAADFNEIISRHDLSGENIEEIRIKKRGFFEEIILKDGTLLTGVTALLKKLKKEKIKLAVASSRNERQVKIVIDRLELTKYFGAIVGYNEELRRKPFPDIFLAAAANLKIKPSLCVVIEDSESGVIAGKNAGMKVIAVPNRYTANQDFSKADKVVNNLSEITMGTFLFKN